MKKPVKLSKITRYYDYEKHPIATSLITVVVFPFVFPYLLFLLLTEM